MKAFSTLAFAAVVATVALPASAQFAKAEDAIKYRQSALSVLGTHFGRLGAMANGKMPFDAKSAQESAEVVAFMSKLPWAGFGAGTEGGKTKPEVWKEQASSMTCRARWKPKSSSSTLPPRPVIWTISRRLSARQPIAARAATTASAISKPRLSCIKQT